MRSCDLANGSIRATMATDRSAPKAQALARTPKIGCIAHDCLDQSAIFNGLLGRSHGRLSGLRWQ